MPKKITTQSFKNKAVSTHENKYDYSLVEYKNSKTKIKIICSKHGVFNQRPSKRLQGQGCPDCNKPSYNTENFIEKVKSIHPTLIFNKTIYIDSKTRVLYECKKHGIKNVFPTGLIQGEGCKNCAMSKPKIKKKDWISRFLTNNNKNISYELVPSEFKSEDKISFICKIHGEFKQSPANHSKGHSCPKCGLEKHKDKRGWSAIKWKNMGSISKNFDSFKVYIIRCWNDEEEFYKIGKTYTTVNYRFKNNSQIPYDYEVLKIIKGDAEEISNLELKLQEDNKKFKYIPKIKFSGSTECYIDLSLF